MDGQKGGGAGSRSKWKPKAGYTIQWNRKSAIVFSEVHKQPQFTHEAKTVAYCSLTPRVAVPQCQDSRLL